MSCSCLGELLCHREHGDLNVFDLFPSIALFVLIKNVYAALSWANESLSKLGSTSFDASWGDFEFPRFLLWENTLHFLTQKMYLSMGIAQKQIWIMI